MGEEQRPTEDLPRCRCGYDRTHYMVTPEGKYTGWGWFWVLFGVTTKPVRIEYRCRRCHQMFDSTEDPKDLAEHI